MQLRLSILVVISSPLLINGPLLIVVILVKSKKLQNFDSRNRKIKLFAKISSSKVSVFKVFATQENQINVMNAYHLVLQHLLEPFKICCFNVNKDYTLLQFHKLFNPLLFKPSYYWMTESSYSIISNKIAVYLSKA